MEISQPDFWNNPAEAEKTVARLNAVKKRYEPWEKLMQDQEDLRQLLEMALAENESSLENDITQALLKLRKKYHELRLHELLGDEMDPADAFLTIHSGAGGTEACDWVSMLYRMYSRWIERKNFKSTLYDIQEAEGGIKSITLEVKGEYCFGLLKGENGIHRLVRISPFDSAKRRHTSFASVYVSPIVDDSIDIDLKMEDLRIDTYRSQGAGGQHVNKTDSAVRITHQPTGIVVQCQNQRSQHKNKAQAMAVLRSRLYEYYKAEKEAEMESKSLEKRDISWGNQIRSYVFHPYNMVKDHRTNQETGNTQAVMDGELDAFIEAFLQMDWQNKRGGVVNQ